MAAVEPGERRPGWLAAGAEATAGPWLTGVRQRPAARPARPPAASGAPGPYPPANGPLIRRERAVQHG